MRLNHNNPRQRRQADLTGLINIVFLILIFFIVAGALRPFSARDIELAKIERNAGNSVAPSQLVVHADGRIQWRGEAVSMEELGQLAVPAVDADKKTFIVVADGRLDARRLLEVAHRLKAAGHDSVAVMSERVRQP